MSVLICLLRLKFKNQVKHFFRSPGKLILTALMLVLFALVLWSGNMQRAETGAPRDRAELYAIITCIYMFIFVLMAYTGLSKGATFFSMADVNLLFPSPTEPFRILIYGLVQQLGTSLMVGVFLIFQYSWMNGQYAVSMPELLLILLGYSLCVFTAQIVAMLLYTISAASERRRALARLALPVVVGLFLIQPVIQLIRAAVAAESLITALPRAAGGLSLRLMPFVGWLASFVGAALERRASAWLWICLTGVGFAAMIVALRFIQQDYYEDVLQGTETLSAARERTKAGKLAQEGGSRTVKLGGRISGTGARVFFSKHLIENRRAGRLFMSGAAWIEIAAVIAFGAFMRFEGGWIAALAFGIYMQLLLSTNARWVRELLLPYVYLVPEPPFRKLLWCLSQSLLQIGVQSALIWIALGFILQLSIPLTIALIIARIALGVLFIAGNLLVTQLWSNVVAKWLELTLFFIIEIALLIPGIAAMTAIFISGWSIFGLTDVTAALALAVLEAPLALGVLYACRHVLTRAEFNT
ncbi:MAG: putative ABC exporter domain-containing protein [Oscillospiraceae bacterium]|jgi:hypothetical protein|nr:putative ABC exporter domain-containing protein [Oscillospiraceae bacterium]